MMIDHIIVAFLSCTALLQTCYPCFSLSLKYTESNLPDKRELMTLIAKIQLKKDSLEKNELSAKKQKK